MSDLFQVPEKLSPRLEWMKRHGITCEAKGGSFIAIRTITVLADNDEDALLLMARKLGVKHFTEEEFERATQPVWDDE